MSTQTNKIIISALENTFGGIHKASKQLHGVVNYSTLWRWKNNKQTPNLATIEKMVLRFPQLSKLIGGQ
jgi:transposase